MTWLKGSILFKSTFQKYSNIVRDILKIHDCVFKKNPKMNDF